MADSDSEFDDMETDEQPNMNRNKKKTDAWIEEDGEDIVDFTDPSARTKIICMCNARR